ncbi:MAG: sulfotransferase [Acidobacteriota bacterium]|nr:sulfotransferase [Acidobacteriota bacterium]
MRAPPPIPSFFIVGPPCTGTSWLHQVLSQHASLPLETKETRFFDVHFRRGLDWYRSHYPGANEKMPAGEVAPTYFASTEARNRIWVLNPKAKIVCTFRNPVDRVISLHRLKRAYGMYQWSLEEAMLRDSELTESSKYGRHLKAWQADFGSNRVLITIYDDLNLNPQLYVDKIVDFIGIRRFALTSSELEFTHTAEEMTLPKSYWRTRLGMAAADWLKAQRLNIVVNKVKQTRMLKIFLGGGPPFDQVPAQVIRRLHEQFRPEVEELEILLNRDLSGWKIPVKYPLNEKVLAAKC